jgi:hypothetical protein
MTQAIAQKECLSTLKRVQEEYLMLVKVPANSVKDGVDRIMK